MNRKIVLITIFYMCSSVKEILGDCYINIPTDLSVQPKFFNKGGKLPISYSQINVPSNGAIVARCDTKFKTPAIKGSEVNVICENTNNYNHKLHIGGEAFYIQTVYMECEKKEIQKMCQIKLPAEEMLRPKIYKKFGSHVALMTYEGQSMDLSINGELLASCGAKFEKPNWAEPNLLISCDSNYQIHIAGKKSTSSDIFLECGQLQNCQIQLTQNVSTRPTFYRNSREALVTPEDISIDITEKDLITASCDNKFKSPFHLASQLNITCENGRLRIADNETHTNTSEVLECVSAPRQQLTASSPLNVPQLCKIQLTTEDPTNRPRFYKKIGTRNVLMSPEVSSLNVPPNGKILAKCDTTFASPYELASQLNITCENGQLTISDNELRTAFVNLTCKSATWKLYETSSPFSWCPPAMSSYLIIRSYYLYDLYLAGVCYDWQRMTLASLRYKPNSSNNLYLQTVPELVSYRKIAEIEDFSSNFNAENIKTSDYDNPQTQKWLEFANYEKHSIIQHNKLKSDIYSAFSGLLTIDWWPSLRLGNWRQYEEALAQHIELSDIEYDILAGISGNVSIPIYRETCHQSPSMINAIDNKNRTLPLYVWHHLKSATSDIVIIGVNSPFFGYYNATEIIFCNDICHQIEWLKQPRSKFRYGTLGVIFCCSANEVMSSFRLDGAFITETDQSVSTESTTDVNVLPASDGRGLRL